MTHDSMQVTLKGGVAVVTGAGGGIGAAIANAVVAQGATVFLVGRQRSHLEAALSAPNTRNARIFPADLTRPGDIQAIRNKVEQEFGHLDLLVHSAGVISHATVEQGSVEDFDAQYAANLRGPYLLTQTMLPLLKNCGGQIVFINSSAGLAARPNSAQFCATQHAFKALAESLRAEVNGDGVRVLNVYPGRTATSRQAAMYAKSGAQYRPELLLQPEDIASVVLNAVTLPRTAEVTDISIRPMQKSY
jgi:NADP-dependent 3-hydroxy acid dehydrogenase YdfG